MYHSFKDADALDRYRLGPWGLAPKFLRSEQSRSLMPFAQQLVNETIDEETMKKVMEVTRPFAERMKRGE